MSMPTTHSSGATRTHLRDQLEARRTQLMEELQRLRARIREHGSLPTGISVEDVDDDGDLDATLIDIVNTALRRMDVALERLRRGAYGQCTRCRVAIAEARLVAMPFAVRCQCCESARERESAPHAALGNRLWAENPF
jgi:DnaK suppressor protein